MTHQNSSKTPPQIQMKDITIGVELEMILFDLPPKITNSPHGALEFTANALKPLSTSLNTTPTIYGPMLSELERLKSQDTSVEGLKQRAHPELTFQIKYDCTVSGSHPTIPNHYGRAIEIATPILNSTNYPSTIQTMCHDITSACKANNASVGFNKTCGLHVHIGLGRAYTLPELKRISKAIILFEPQMDQHHPPHRSVVPELGMGMFYPCRSSPGLGGLSVCGMLQKIDEQGSVLGLLRLVNGLAVGLDSYTRFYKYNLTCVLLYGTVEFRQGAGTMDDGWVVRWVGSVVRFVTAAVEARDEVFWRWAGAGGVVGREVCERFGIPCLSR